MKREIKLILFIVLLMAAMLSCENQDKEFSDFDYATTYFAYQYQVRTLILGDYYFDNTNENDLKIVISATMGGVRENGLDRIVDFVVDESLVEDMYIGTQQILPMPTRYYTLSDESRIIIPKGKLAGGVEVQFTEDFLNDPNAVGPEGAVYVIPVRIIASTTDSILLGKAAVNNPDRRISSDWDVAPKDYALVGVNYVNEYHGTFLLRGASIQSAIPGVSADTTIVYRERDVEADREVAVNTVSRNSVIFTKDIARKNGKSPGNFTMQVTFDANGNGIITTDATSAFPVTGTAKFVKDSESWGGKKRNAIYLDYVVDDGIHQNTAKDTLVYRDKGVYFQLFEPAINP